MSSKIVVGGAWGDEGKGKVIDYLVEKEKYEYVNIRLFEHNEYNDHNEHNEYVTV